MSMIDDIKQALDAYNKYGQGQIFPNEPEWLAALVEYIEAAEHIIALGRNQIINGDLISDAEFKLQVTRIKLGLEGE